MRLTTVQVTRLKEELTRYLGVDREMPPWRQQFRGYGDEHRAMESFMEQAIAILPLPPSLRDAA